MTPIVDQQVYTILFIALIASVFAVRLGAELY